MSNYFNAARLALLACILTSGVGAVRAAADGHEAVEGTGTMADSAAERAVEAAEAVAGDATAAAGDMTAAAQETAAAADELEAAADEMAAAADEMEAAAEEMEATAEAMPGAAAVEAAPIALTDQEMRRGKILFLQCRACHALTPGDNGGKIGPSLAGVFGRTAGSADYFDGYSAALREADHVWNSETLERWLAGPADMVAGTSMVFAGISDAAQRELLVRYLQVVTEPDAD